MLPRSPQFSQQFQTTTSILTLCAVLAMAGTLSACGRAPQAAVSPPPARVQFQEVTSGAIADSSDYVATLISRNSVTLQPQVPGQVSAIYVKAGDRVSKGQLLLVIDPAQQQAAVGSSVAAAQSQQAAIGQVRSTLHSLEEQRKALTSAVELSRTLYNRYAALYAQQSASQQDVEKYRDELNRAQASLDANQAQIQAQRAGVSTTQKQYEQAKAVIRQEQAQLRHYRITAPFSGIVGDVPVKLGNYVQPLTTLLSVTDNDALEVNISVPSERVSELKIGLPLEIVDGMNQVIARTTLSFVSPSVDKQAQTILVKAILKNADSVFKADQVVNARLIWKEKPGIRIPSESVVHMGGRDFVYVAEKASEQPAETSTAGEHPASSTPGAGAGKAMSGWVAKQKPIMLSRIEGPYYVLESGLKTGDRLIVSGVQKLADGAPIAPQP